MELPAFAASMDLNISVLFSWNVITLTLIDRFWFLISHRALLRKCQSRSAPFLLPQEAVKRLCRVTTIGQGASFSCSGRATIFVTSKILHAHYKRKMPPGLLWSHGKA